MPDVVRVAVLDLERRIAVIQAYDDGTDTFPHRLRGTLAGMLAEPTWHLVVAFMQEGAPRSEVAAVLIQAARWATEGECRLTVTSLRDIAHLTTQER